MATWAYILVGLAVVVGPIITALVLLRKAPAESRKVKVETVDVNVRIAGELRDDALEDRKRMQDELLGLRKEFDKYKRDTDAKLDRLTSDLVAAQAELQRERAEKDRVKRENARLTERVAELEQEVARLKARHHDKELS